MISYDLCDKQKTKVPIQILILIDLYLKALKIYFIIITL